MNDLFEEYNKEHYKKVLELMKNHSLPLGEPLKYYNAVIDTNGRNLGGLFWVNKDNFRTRVTRLNGTGAGNIYKIENTKTDKIYIGQSEDIYARKAKHVWDLYNGSHKSTCMQMDFNLYGMKHFTYEILATVEMSKDLLKVEEEYILKYNSEYPNGYNSPIKGSLNKKLYSKRPSKKFIEFWGTDQPMISETEFYDIEKHLKDEHKIKLKELINKYGEIKLGKIEDEKTKEYVLEFFECLGIKYEKVKPANTYYFMFEVLENVEFEYGIQNIWDVENKQMTLEIVSQETISEWEKSHGK